MKTMRERWICPDMDLQVFKPQEFIAACEMTVIGHTIKIITTPEDTFLPNVKMILDQPRPNGDGLWTEEDHNQNPNQNYTSDSNQPGAGTELMFTGMGWIRSDGQNIKKPGDYPAGTNFNTSEYQYVAAFQKVGTTNLHVYAADWEEIWAKNQS